MSDCDWSNKMTEGYGAITWEMECRLDEKQLKTRGRVSNNKSRVNTRGNKLTKIFKHKIFQDNTIFLHDIFQD